MRTRISQSSELQRAAEEAEHNERRLANYHFRRRMYEMTGETIDPDDIRPLPLWQAILFVIVFNALAWWGIIEVAAWLLS